jgi:hypothetical protein
MGQPIYITDPAVAVAYHADIGTWITVADEAETQWLLDNHHGYHLDVQRGLPAAGFVDPRAPLPFVPYSPTPPGPEPARMTATIADAGAGVFTVTFGGLLDTLDASGHFTVVDAAAATLADVTYPQSAGTTFTGAAGLLKTALTPHAPPLALVQTGAVLEIRGVDPVIVNAVTGALTLTGPARRKRLGIRAEARRAA